MGTKKDRIEMSTNNVLTGLAAFAGGFLAGVLLAPSSGRETRDRLSDEARNRMKSLEGQVRGVEDRLASLSDQIHDASDQFRTAAAHKVLPDVPEDPEAFKLDEEEVEADLRHMPRK